MEVWSVTMGNIFLPPRRFTPQYARKAISKSAIIWCKERLPPIYILLLFWLSPLPAITLILYAQIYIIAVSKHFDIEMIILFWSYHRGHSLMTLFTAYCYRLFWVGWRWDFDGLLLSYFISASRFNVGQHVCLQWANMALLDIGIYYAYSCWWTGIVKENIHALWHFQHCLIDISSSDT